VCACTHSAPSGSRSDNFLTARCNHVTK
jgi:hypothetical protein